MGHNPSHLSSFPWLMAPRIPPHRGAKSWRTNHLNSLVKLIKLSRHIAKLSRHIACGIIRTDGDVNGKRSF
jgi:hypothetical protein